MAGSRVAARFAELLTPHNSRLFDWVTRTLEPLAEDPCVEMYTRFALSSNERGRAVAALLSGVVPLAGVRYLDIGCAYAGFLVAFAERGASVLGIELAPHLIEAARCNLADSGVEAEVLCRDAMSLSDIVAMCGRFDVISCNDVIEHVEDPAKLLEHVALLLRPGGVGYLEIPNHNAATFVRSDGHYMKLGITLLDYKEALEYWCAGAPAASYTVRHYLDLDQYEALARRAGLSFELLPQTLDGVTPEGVQASVEEVRRAAAEERESVPEVVRPLVTERLSAYLRRADRMPAGSEEERRKFLLEFGVGFWKVLVRKRD